MTRTAIVNRLLAGGALLVMLFSVHAPAQMVTLSEEKYTQPPKEIADIVTAPRHLNVTLTNLGPDREHFLIVRGAGMPTLAEFSRPFANLGETAFDYRAGRARQLTTRKNSALEILNYKTGAKLEIVPPKDMWLGSPEWSPDGSKIAYYVHSEDATHIYVAATADGKGRRITQTPVLATMVTAPEWTPDGTTIIAVLVPATRKPMPTDQKGDEEPSVKMTNPKATATRTFRFLMRTPYDKDLFEWLVTGQLALIDVTTGKARHIGEPAMYRSVAVSPDGKYLRATTIQKPFSYIVPVNNFASLEAIYDLDGKKLADVLKRELREDMVSRGGRDDPARDDADKRSIAWRPDGQGLSFLQMEPKPKQDEKSAEEIAEEEKTGAKRKDRVMQWLPPFDETSLKMLYENEDRIGSLQYSQDAQTMFMTETKEGEEHLFAVTAADTKTRHTIFKRKTNDALADPGTLMTRAGAGGGIVVRMAADGQSVFLSGTQYFKNPVEQTPRPFVSKLNIMTGESRKVFESEENVFESVLTAADDEMNTIFTTRETAAAVPDCYVRELAGGSLRKLTANVDYAPAVTRAIRKRLQVERVDGIKLWVNLTLPADYVEGKKLPAMFWFYPREYQNQREYDRDRSVARYNKNSFPNTGTRSMSILAVRGYAVVEPDCPIIGPQGQMNNNYVADLRNNLWAVIDSLDRMGYIDRDRLGIGGHSYGAFSTANALAHTPFFKAGIAGDGNYNRTLTPLTFQSERRFLWDAREAYLNMSPILYANQMNGALLMYHGMDDANNGTDPINSERLFHVLNGLGKTAAVYMYPYEDHGPAMKETLLDLWARWDAWLDKYVKNPKKDDKAPAKPTQSRD